MAISKVHSDQHTSTFTASYEVTIVYYTSPKFFNLEKCTIYCVVSTCSTTSQKEIHVPSIREPVLNVAGHPELTSLLSAPGPVEQSSSKSQRSLLQQRSWFSS
jgi:hypothetical protein